MRTLGWWHSGRGSGRMLLAALLAVGLLGSAVPLGVASPVRAQSSAQSAVLSATLQLPGGSIQYPIELGELHFFSESEAPFLVQVLDGCAVNGHLWVLGVGFSSEAAPLRVLDATTGLSHTAVLPAYTPGEPVRATFDAEAIAACEDAPLGGLPTLVGTATYVGVTDRCQGFSERFTLSSEGSEDAYVTFVRGSERNRLSQGKAVTAIDESQGWDELHLLAEGRTPRRIEGVVIAGQQGMLPPTARLQRQLDPFTKARVRRAFEAAKNGRIPRGLLDELGLRGFDCVHYVRLDFDTPGAASQLERAGWVVDGGADEGPPPLAEERFTVEIAHADGTSRRLPLVGPVAGTDDEGLLWHHQDEQARAEIVDACGLTGTFWTLGATVTDEPVEMLVTDTQTGETSLQVLWGEDDRPASAVDTGSLACA